ncbi:S24 family peptidase [Sphingomonas sp. ASV193]|uniref:S24 family peptidase n=1 Tax=Sphingomonas sp. ASV193 TaxID=3144405 RepID=UPI0032E87A60
MESYAALSRLLDRNDAYIQQYLRKGTPRRLPERERRILARHFGVPDSALGGPEESSREQDQLVPVMRQPVRASAGPGALGDDERSQPYFAFDPRWLKLLTSTPASRLSAIRVDGDSMAPTLSGGDDILVDLDDCGERIRDGIYVIRVDEALLVKRLTLHPLGRKVTVQSDNPAYSDWPDCDIGDIHCVGRVIWAGRRIN